ncbi:HK97 gp10 family phage protein [Lentilactobacillus sp. Marseille-Q4993]|uniref:HK97 gp10 family phage protein n=1 Tax=Lentilactobacillus sp. Marseille-Q4993 TaxID=3039492 RepID=UPI0024BCFD4F|nr:HK97 gp10 family phage protein [Lentilactobacillus sp. Marseille-Q4993]
MAFGTIDDAEFQAFANRVKNKVAAKEAVHKVGQGMQKLANVAIRDVKGNTPVDTGRLRGAWNTSGMSYGGGSFSFELQNNTEYAGFVENGHRTRGGGSWVPGQFFLKKSLVHIEGQFPTTFQPIFDEALRGLLD